jgi:fucose permease
MSGGVVIWLAFLGFVSLGLPDGLIGVAWPSVHAAVSVPLDALGTLVAVTIAGYLASSFAAGPLIRRMTLGTALAGATALAALALLGIALSAAWPLVLLAGALSGLAGGVVDAGLNAYGARHFSGRTMNWLHASWGFGTTLGPLIVTAALDLGLGWRWSYGAAATAQGALALVFLANRQRWRDPSITDAAFAPSSFRGTLGQPSVWLGMAVFFVYSGVELAVAHWSYSLLTLGRGMDETIAGVLVAVYWASLTAGRVLFGFVADRVAVGPALRAGLGCAVLGAGLLCLDREGTAPAALVLMGMGLAPVFASLVRATPGRVGAAHADNAIGIQIAFAGLGGAAVTALIGLVIAGYGPAAAAPSILVAAILLAGLHEALVATARRRVAPA